MKSNFRTKLVISIVISIFALTAVMSYNSYNNSVDNIVDYQNLTLSKISGKIHIRNNWSAAKVAGICSGSGSYSDPYVIEDYIIDAAGPGNCILIENANNFFRIENCTLLNSGTSLINNGGIKLANVSNGLITGNDCSTNYKGIYIEDSQNNTISGNDVHNNNDDGIYIWYSRNNTISGNTITGNSDDGIYIHDNCNTIIVLGNTITLNGDDGIYLWFCHYNTIAGNTISLNPSIGVHLRDSDNNIVKGNNFTGNGECISELGSSGNEFSDNGQCTYGQGTEAIVGYNLIVLIGVLSILSVIIITGRKTRIKFTN
ncbi:MAG: right-handed parallel beta-helix repeat-containing protein [Promethearchaeota archaeon]|jgi:parallel beta-helix repeat protein